jgi:hypothetical protein
VHAARDLAIAADSAQHTDAQTSVKRNPIWQTLHVGISVGFRTPQHSIPCATSSPRQPRPHFCTHARTPARRLPHCCWTRGREILFLLLIVVVIVPEAVTVLCI